MLLLFIGCTLTGELTVDLSGETPLFNLTDVNKANRFKVLECGEGGLAADTADDFELIWMWEISGSKLHKLDEITYGVVPDGLSEDTASSSLVTGTTYTASLSRSFANSSTNKIEGWDVYWTMGETEAFSGGCP